MYWFEMRGVEVIRLMVVCPVISLPCRAALWCAAAWAGSPAQASLQASIIRTSRICLLFPTSLQGALGPPKAHSAGAPLPPCTPGMLSCGLCACLGGLPGQPKCIWQAVAVPRARCGGASSVEALCVLPDVTYQQHLAGLGPLEGPPLPWRPLGGPCGPAKGV